MERLHVLVVDDEPGMRLGVQRALRDWRFTVADLDEDVAFDVAAAETAEDALAMIREAAPDVLLLDHKLPGMSGLDLLEQLGPTEGMLTVMITAYASLETAVTAIKQGAYDFLAKPFTPTELKATVRKAAESLIMTRQARKLAREKRQVRFEFIRVVAHELKSPLAAVEGYLQIVRNRSAGDDPAVYDRMIDRSLIRCQHMRKMVMDLLDLTRIESGSKQRDLVEVDLREVAERAVETAVTGADREVTIELHAAEPLPMTADEGELEIILNNLVSNAVKYNRDGGRVDVTLRGDDRKVEIEVADTGIGMTDEDLERLFGEFVRIKNDQTRNILGSGLGLSIVKKLALLYGGDVRVRSTPDVGSTFTVTLARAAPAEAEAALAEQHDA